MEILVTITLFAGPQTVSLLWNDFTTAVFLWIL